MRTGIILGGAVSNPALRSALPYDERIGALPSLLAWWVPDAARVTLANGRVAAIASRGQATAVASQATAGEQPLWEASGGPGGRPALFFSRARGDRLPTNAVMPTGGAAQFTKVALVRAITQPGNDQHAILAGSSTGSDSIGVHRLEWQATVGVFYARVGTNSANATVQAAAATNTWHLVMQTWNGATNTIRLALNGGAWVSQTTPGATITDSVLRLGVIAAGNRWDGRMGSPLVLTTDLSTPENAQNLATVKQYYRDRYGITVA